MRPDFGRPSTTDAGLKADVPAAGALSFAAWRAELQAGLRAGGPAVIVRAVSVLGLMILGSIAMWIGLPVLWLWLGSRVQSGLNPSIAPYLLIAVGLPSTMIAVAGLLARLDRTFARLTGLGANNRRIPLPWVKSLRDGRGFARSLTVLEVVMIVSVLVCGAAFATWWLFLAGAPPSSVGNGGLHF